MKLGCTAYKSIHHEISYIMICSLALMVLHILENIECAPSHLMQCFFLFYRSFLPICLEVLKFSLGCQWQTHFHAYNLVVHSLLSKMKGNMSPFILFESNMNPKLLACIDFVKYYLRVGGLRYVGSWKWKNGQGRKLAETTAVCKLTLSELLCMYLCLPTYSVPTY